MFRKRVLPMMASFAIFLQANGSVVAPAGNALAQESHDISSLCGISGGWVYKDAFFSVSCIGGAELTKEHLGSSAKDDNDRLNEESFSYDHEGARFMRYCYRCRISQGCYWANGAWSDSQVNVIKRVPLERVTPIQGKESGFPHPYVDGVTREWDWQLTPLTELSQELGKKASVSGGSSSVPFDCLPISKDSLLLFVLHGGEMVVWQCDNKKWSAKPVERIPTEMAGLFTVYPGKDGAYFFIPAWSGKLFYSAKPAQGKRAMKAIWSDKGSSIRVMIIDAAAGKTFAFTQPADKKAKNSKSFFFELSNPVRPVVYRPKDIPLCPKRERVTLKSYAEFLVRKKEISLK